MHARNLSLQEKKEDQKKIASNIERRDKRDKDYAEFYNKVSDSIDQKMNFFKPNIHSEANLVQNREHAVRNNEAKLQQNLATKAEYEDAIIRANKRNCNDALHFQMKEKEQRRERERQERVNETNMMKARVKEIQAYETMLHNDRI